MEPLLDEAWLARLKRHHQLLVAYSGGLDSTVLLHVLASNPAFRPHVQAVHIHHGLSPNASDWQAHCTAFCESHQIPLITQSVSLSTRVNLEEEARRARYDVFSLLLEKKGCLLLAHHQDDQAETLLLQLCRGTGIAGLAGMPSSKLFAQGELARPFLRHSRNHLRAYAAHHALTWVEDESNDSMDFSRNYVRHQVMPLLQQRWPAATRLINTCAMHCQQAKENLDDLARIDCPDVMQKSDCLLLGPLLHLTRARLSNVLRVWLTCQGVRAGSTKKLHGLIDEVIFAKEDKTPRLQWGVFQLRRYRDVLYLLRPAPSSRLFECHWVSFPHPYVSEDSNQVLNAYPADKGLHVPEGSRVDVRYRTGGERFVWRGKRRLLKKLLQTWGVPPWLRADIPLIFVDGKLAAVLDFGVSDPYYGAHGERVYQIERSVME